MKKYFNTLGFLFITVIGCFGQVQISDVQNVSLVDYSNRRFITTPNKLLLVEMLSNQTKIFEIEEGSATKIQEWQFDPLDEVRVELSDGLNLLNLCFLQGDTLFEVYTRSVNATSLNTGKLLARYEFPDSINRIMNVEPAINKSGWIVTSTDKNYINHVGFFNLDSTKYYDRQIKDGFRIGDLVFKLQNTTLISENIITGELSNYFSNQVTRFNTSSNKTQPYLWISLSNNKHYYIDANHGTREIPCNIPSQTASLFWSDSLLFFNIQTSPSYTFQVVNTNTCQVVSSGLAQGYMNLYSLMTPSQNFICYTVFGSPTSDGFHFIYNVAQKKWDKFSINGDDCYALTQQFVDDRIFVLGIDRMLLTGQVAGFYEIDFKNNFVVNHKFYDQSDDAFPVHFAIHPVSKLVYITTRSIKGKSDLWVQKVKAKTPEKIGTFLTSKNSGIPTIISQLIHNDKIYYSTPVGIFTLDETSNIFLNDAINCSPFVQKNNFIYAIVQKADNVFGYLKINTDNQQITFKSFQEAPNLVRSFAIEGKAIVAGDNLDGGYFDLAKEKFTKFKYNGNELQIFNVIVSKDNALFHGVNQGQRELYLWNAASGEIKIVPGYANLFPHALPDYEGGYYLLPGNPGFGDKLKKMNSNGDIKDVTTIGAGPWYYYLPENGLAGDVHTFPFPGMNEVIFISEKNGKINDVRIPFKNTLYFENFYWQEFEETVVVETYFNNKYHTWVWKYDEPPTDITPNGREDRLVSAMMHGASVVFVYFNKEESKTLFALYNTLDKSLMEMGYLESYYQAPLKPVSSYFFDGGIFYFSITTTDFGEEMWSYELNDQSLELVKDFSLGSTNGNPDNFVHFKDNILFIASASDGSRQWFKLRQSSGVTIENNNNEISVLYPNPALTYVKVNGNTKQVIIYDINGTIRYSANNLREGEIIQLTGFESGIYMVKITAEHGEQVVSKLVIGN